MGSSRTVLRLEDKKNRGLDLDALASLLVMNVLYAMSVQYL